MVSVKRALNQYTLSNIPCMYSTPVYDKRVSYMEIPVYRAWHELTASMQPGGMDISLDDMLSSIDGTFDFWFKENPIVVPQINDAFFIRNVGYFFIKSASPWKDDYTHVTAVYRSSHIITDASGDIDFSLKNPKLPVYENPYATDGMLDKILSAHAEAFSLLYSDRSFYVADQDISRKSKYAVLRFVDQEIIGHPMLNNSDSETENYMSQQGEVNYNIKVMLSFVGGAALADRNLFETMIFHDTLMDVWESYGVAPCDDFYPENISDTDQIRRIQRARTSYTVNANNVSSSDVETVEEVTLEDLTITNSDEV